MNIALVIIIANIVIDAKFYESKIKTVYRLKGRKQQNKMFCHSWFPQEMWPQFYT